MVLPVLGWWRAGRTCVIRWVKTVPNGTQPVAAEFRYELEYRENGRVGKLTLPVVDRWPSSSGSVTRLRLEGNRLIFTLPLNVTGKITFSNGSRKSMYEPLPVHPAD